MYFGIHIILFLFFFMHTEKRKTYDLIVYVCYCKTAESARTYTYIESGFILLFLLKMNFLLLLFFFVVDSLCLRYHMFSFLFCKYVLHNTQFIFKLKNMKKK